MCASALIGLDSHRRRRTGRRPRARAVRQRRGQRGEPVSGLGPDAFIVREDGARREVLRVSRATEPIDIALLVDNSTAASHEITFLREALSKFVATMAPGNNVAVIALADRPTILVDYTSDTKRLSDTAADCSRCRRAA